ncbi:hypothetical protein [Pelagibacterium luteolum]|uniref:Mll5186 protein n=1 Tax=Pelagibacterium luteolum TaxID=440168 RepID=A0A1G7VD07_9HYPH|nr:hypothetical protein [Pelagibacterium luteolum]SDG57634.1 hypothetical protein SAMN04487974_10463 [Pelagibacterium luteolum]
MALTPAETVVATQAKPADTSSYVDWPAIIGGAVTAAAISLVMLTFGSAIGLTLTDPFGRDGVSLVWVAIAMAIWVVWVQVSAMMVGGYLTGRMRRRNFDATEHESDIRDGFHGLLVWATAVVISGALAFGGLSSIAQGVGNAVGGATSAVAEQTAEADPFAGTVDLLFRGDTTGTDPEAARGEVSRIIVSGVTGDGISDADRQYLVDLTAARTGLSPDEVEARVNDVIAQAQAVQDDVAAAAEQAADVTILVAFLTAASLAISAAGAWFAATMGGNHRDKQTAVPFFARRDRRV